MNTSDWLPIHTHILQLEQEGRVTRTFRRLDPDRQLAVLTAILDEAAANGPASLNIKQVAERAGVSVGSLYTYFNDRDGMLAFAVELSTRFLVDSMNSFRPLLAALPLRDALTAYLAGGVEWSQMQAGLLRLFARAAYHGDPELADRLVQPVAEVLQDTVRDILRAAAERGELRDGIDLEAAVRIIHAAVIAVSDSLLLPYLNTYFLVYDDTLPFTRAADTLLAMILHGIGKE